MKKPPPGKSGSTSKARKRQTPKRSNHVLGAETMLRYWREDVPNDRLAHLVKDATRSLNRGLQRRLAEHSVSFGHWAFLRILWNRDGLTQRELSEQAGLMEPTAYAALLAMEKLGYVERNPAPEGEGRKVFVHLTKAGRALKNVLVPLAVEVNELAIAGVSAEDVAATRRTLFAIVRNLSVDEIESAQKDLRHLLDRDNPAAHLPTKQRSRRRPRPHLPP